MSSSSSAAESEPATAAVVSYLPEFTQYSISVPPPLPSFLYRSDLPFSLAAALGPIAFSSRSARPPSL